MARRRTIAELLIKTDVDSRRFRNALNDNARLLRSFQTISIAALIGVAAASGSAAASIAVIGTASAVAGAGITALAAGGVAAFASIGIAAQKESPRVVDAFKKMREHVGGHINEMTIDWQDSLVNLAERTDQAFSQISGSIASNLEFARTVFDQVIEQVFDPRTVDNVASAMDAGVKNLGPLMAGMASITGNIIDNMAAGWEQLTEAMGAATPGLLDGWKAISDRLVPSIFDFLDGLTRLASSAFPSFIQLLSTLIEQLSSMTDAVAESGALESMFTGLGDGIGAILGTIEALVTALGPGLGQVFRDLGDIVASFEGPLIRLGSGFETLVGVLSTVLETTGPVVTKIMEFGAALLEELSSPLKMIVESLLPPLGDLLIAVLDSLEPLIPVVGDLAQSLEDSVIPAIADSIEKFTAFVDKNPEVVQAAAAIALAFGALMKLKGIMMTIAAVVNLPLLALMALGAALMYLWKNNETFREIVTNAWNAVRDNIGPIIETIRMWLVDKLGAAVEWLKGIWESLQPRIQSIMANFAIIGEILGPVVQWIGEKLPGAFQWLWSVAQPIITFIIDILGGALKGAIDAVVQVFQGAVQIITGILQVFRGIFTGSWSEMWAGIKNIFSGIVNTIVGIVRAWIYGSVLKIFGAGFRLITGIVRGGWNFIKSIFTGVLNFLKNFVKGQFGAIKNTFTQSTGIFKRVISAAFNFIKSVVTRVLNTVKSVIRGAFNVIKSIFQGVINGVKNIWHGGWSAVTNSVKYWWQRIKAVVKIGITLMKNFIMGGANNVVTMFKNLPGRILRGLGKLGSLLLSAGKDLIKGLIKGIGNMAGAVKDKILGVGRKAADAFKGFFGIGSPSKLFMGFGKNIGEGAVIGISKMASEMERATKNLSENAKSGWGDPRLGVSGMVGAGTTSPFVSPAGLNGNGRGLSVTMHIDEGAFQISTPNAEEFKQKIPEMASMVADEIIDQILAGARA